MVLSLFLMVIIFFFSKAVYHNFSNISTYTFSCNYLYIFLSLVFALLFVLYIGILWIHLIKEPNIPFLKALHIHLTSWLAKYIPGNAGIVVSKVYFLSKYNIEKKRALVISIYENVFQITSAFIISIPLIIFYFLWAIWPQYLYLWIIFVALSIIFLHPNIFYTCINIALKLFKRQTLGREYFLSYREILKYFILYCIAVCINGLAFYFMINWIVYIPFTDFLPLLWAWSFAWVIWILAIFAPWWLWVREWVLVLFLKFLLPIEVAIIVSIFSRFRTTIIDWLLWLYILISSVVTRKKIKI